MGNVVTMGAASGRVGQRDRVAGKGSSCPGDWLHQGLEKGQMSPHLQRSKLQKTWSHGGYIQFCLSAKVISQRGNKNG